MVLKCSGELNRMKLKTLLFLKFCLGKLTGPVMAVCVGLPAQWVWGATTHFFIITLFYFLCPDSYKNMFICFFFPYLFAKLQINTTSPSQIQWCVWGADQNTSWHSLLQK